MGKEKLSKNLLIFISSAIFFFIILETTLALFWPHKVTIHPYHEQYHPVLGWTNKPFMNGEVRVTRKVYFHRRHNNKGLRSTRDINYEKPPEIRRILLLGDSFFWGFGVDDKDVLSEVLQQKVGNHIEIINGAVPGYGTDQELLWLAEEGLKYKPDLVILGFFPTNDLDEISSSINYGYPKPYFSLKNKRLVVHNIPVPDTRETRRKAFEEPDTLFGKVKKFLRHNTHTYQFITGRLNSIPSLRKFFLKIGLADEYTKNLPGIPNFRLDPKRVQDLSNALIKEIKRVSREAGADFLLVFIPQKEPLKAKPDGYEDVNEDAFEWNSRVSKYLSEFSSHNSIQFLDLLPVFRKHQEKGEHLYNPEKYDHHWTPLGHKVAAEAIFEWLSHNSWIASGQIPQ